MAVSLRHQPAAFWIVPTALALVLGAAGCSSKAADAKRIRAEYDAETGRLTRLEYDGNGNGKPDSWAFMDGTKIHKLEADHNEDGRIDRWEYYDVSLQSAAGKPIPDRIESAKRLDGRVSRREFFEGGKLARIEEDTNGDGLLDKWEIYVGGVLSVQTLDLQFRGKPDRRFIYRRDGSIERIEEDPAGTGQFQTVKQ